MVKIAPSILAADFDRLEEEIESVVQAGADMIHVDVMDGNFVKNKTPGMEMYETAKRVTNLPIDTHLMVENPEEWIDSILHITGCSVNQMNDDVTDHIEKQIHNDVAISQVVRHNKDDIISFHIEAVSEMVAYRLIHKIHDRGLKACIAIKPDTLLEDVYPFLPILDMVLIMTVEPGYGGQVMIEECLEKVEELREMEPDLDIEVDGGINLETVSLAKEAGANVIVAGTAIMKEQDKKYVISEMKR